MTWSTKYPRVYKSDTLYCLMLDKIRGRLFFKNEVYITINVPRGMKRCEWTDLPVRVCERFMAYLPDRLADSLFKLPEFIKITYKGETILKRRKRLHLKPTYYCGGVGFSYLSEAKEYVQTLPQADDSV